MVSGAVRLLVWVRYRSDAERKRLESILDKYRDSLRIVRPSGAVYIIEATSEEALNPFISELYAKLGDTVSTYVVGQEYRVEPRRYSVRVCFPGLTVDRVWGYVEAFMINFRGVLVSETRAGRRYSLYVKGEGEAKACVNVVKAGDGVCVYLELEGYSRAPDIIGSRFRGYMISLGGRVSGP